VIEENVNFMTMLTCYAKMTLKYAARKLKICHFTWFMILRTWHMYEHC